MIQLIEMQSSHGKEYSPRVVQPGSDHRWIQSAAPRVNPIVLSEPGKHLWTFKCSSSQCPWRQAGYSLHIPRNKGSVVEDGARLKEAWWSAMPSSKKRGGTRCPAQIICVLFRRQRCECVSPSADLGLRCTQWASACCSSQRFAGSWDLFI